MANDDYLGDASKVTLIPGAANAVARARALGFATVIFSNQSGVARGMFDEDAVGQVNARLEELLKAENPAAIIDRHEFCPFHPDGTVETYSQESPLRKPLPGMIHHAAEAMALDLSKSWVIGDASRDIEAGHAAGCRTILVRDPSLSLSPAAAVALKVQPDYQVTKLAEAMDFIERSKDVPVTVAPATESAVPAAPAQQLARPSQPPVAPTPKLELLASDILREIRRQREEPHDDFSVTKLLAGIVQVLVLAVLFVAYLNRWDAGLLPTLVFALTLQTMTIALLIMARQR